MSAIGAAMKRLYRFARTGPDFLMDELTEVLRMESWFDFNSLFLRVFERLRERKATGGGQEMLRLRMYEKLQTLVQQGIVEKSGRNYRGIASALTAFAENVATQHCRRLLEVVKDRSHKSGTLEKEKGPAV
jgi:hypothetical protein